MSATYYVHALRDELVRMLRESGAQLPPEDEESRHPTWSEVRKALQSLEGYVVTERREESCWWADVRRRHDDGVVGPETETSILMNGPDDPHQQNAITFEGGDAEFNLAIVERLTHMCGVLVFRAETSLQTLVIRPGVDVGAVLDPWRVKRAGAFEGRRRGRPTRR
jgi:hypothetical protein